MRRVAQCRRGSQPPGVPTPDGRGRAGRRRGAFGAAARGCGPGAASPVLQGRLPRVLPQAMGDRTRIALVRLHELHHPRRALLRPQPLRLAGRQPGQLEPQGPRGCGREPHGAHLRRAPPAAQPPRDPVSRVLRQRADAQLGAARLQGEGRQLGLRRHQPGRVGIHPDRGDSGPREAQAKAKQLLFWSGSTAPIPAGRCRSRRSSPAGGDRSGLRAERAAAPSRPRRAGARARARLGRGREREVADRDQDLDQALLDPHAHQGGGLYRARLPGRGPCP